VPDRRRPEREYVLFPRPQQDQAFDINDVQTITFTSSPPSPAVVGYAYDVGATGGLSGNLVTFSSLSSGVCTVSGNIVNLTGDGDCIVAADQAAGAGYLAAMRKTQTFHVVQPIQQVVAFTSTPPATAVVGGTYVVGLTGGTSGNPIVLASTTSSYCSVAGNIVTFARIGTCHITADQAANPPLYLPAVQQEQTIDIYDVQAITFNSTPPDPGIAGQTYSVAAFGGLSGNPVTFSSLSPTTICTVSGSTVNLIGVGTCTVAADQAALTAANNALAAARAKAQQSNDQAAASLATARQQLSSAKSSLASLRTSTPASTLQMDEAQIQIAQANVNTMQHQLNGATIKSPIAGVVSQVNISAGQSVSGGGSGTGTSSSYAVVVYSPGSYEVTGTVSDAQVNLVAVGQTVQVTPAGSNQALQGKVTAISPAATISSGVATFVVTAQLTDTSNSIKPGISATATIVTNQVVHVLTVPTSAVHTTAAGSTVQIFVNGKPQTVVVTTGASDPTRIQILSGLQLNQTVVIAVISSSVPSSNTGTALGAGGGARGGGGATRGGGTGG